MKEVIVKSANNVTFNFVAADTDTVKNICEHNSIIELFGEDVDTIKNALAVYAGNPIPAASAFRDMILASEVTSGLVLEFDLEAERHLTGETHTEAEEAEEDEGYFYDRVSARPSAGSTGIVTVATSGGLQTTNVDIINGITTIKQAISAEKVKARSGMSEAQISSCNILFNGEQVTAEFADSKVLYSGDTICLTARVASSKG